MALRREYLTTYGVKAEHWVVQSINTNAFHGYADILLAGYVSEEAYHNGADPIEQRRVKVNQDMGFENYLGKKAKSRYSNMNIYELAYNIVKNEDKFFEEAEDC